MKKFIPRAYVREEVDIPARLVIDAGRLVVIPCRIVDRSEGGFKIAMADAWNLPDRLLILADDERTLFTCEMRWQVGSEAGLMFIGACTSAMLEQVLAKLKKADVLGPAVKNHHWFTDA